MGVSQKTERTFLSIDNEMFFTRDGWFFFRVLYKEDGVEFYPYLDFVNEKKPDWKFYRATRERFVDGEWIKCKQACGGVRS